MYLGSIILVIEIVKSIIYSFNRIKGVSTFYDYHILTAKFFTRIRNIISRLIYLNDMD
jgi:hypothetical protein